MGGSKMARESLMMVCGLGGTGRLKSDPMTLRASGTLPVKFAIAPLVSESSLVPFTVASIN